VPDNLTSGASDLGSVNDICRQSGVGWSGDTAILLQRVMPLAKILGPALAGPQERNYDRARRRYYASRFSLFVSYGVNSAATMPGPASVRSLAKKRGPVYDLWPIGLGRYARHALGIIPGETYRKPQAASCKRSLE